MLLLIFTHTISLNTFWYNQISEYLPWEVIVKYNYALQSENKNSFENSCSYEQNSKIFLSKNWLSLKDNIWDIALISFDKEKNIDDIISLLNTDSNVKIAEPNYINRSAVNNISTDDFFWNEQWWLNYISWPEAFRNYGNKIKWFQPVVVWVIDWWVNYNHVDLKWSMWNASSCRLNGRSISCNYWYDFRSNSSTPLPVWDNHWTHIAGIIAATANNLKGMAWVNPYAKIAALKVTDDYASISSSFDDYAILKAIDFSIENWIRIINASYWWANNSDTMKEKIQEFWNHWWIFVATAMNDWINIDNGKNIYPCAYDLDNIICVTAINSYWNRASFANYWSKSVDIAAPWEWILWTTNNPRNMYPYFEDFSTTCNWWNWWSCWYNEGYQFNWKINSPSYQLWSSSNNLIRFDAQCYWWDTLIAKIYQNWEVKWTIKIWYVWNNQNEYKIITPPELYSFYFSIEKEGESTCYIDNVWVYTPKPYWAESDSYDLWNWTSMATAFVSWLASLIRSLNPYLSPAQVIKLIIDNWDVNKNLQGITVSWKTINVKKTLDSVNIVSQNSYNNSDTYNSDTSINDFFNNMFGEDNWNNYNPSPYTTEAIEAFDFASDNWIISATNIRSADWEWYLNRISMAKILSQFAISVLWIQPDEDKYTSFYDVSEDLNRQYDNWVLLAYQLWIMWVWTHYFRPYDRVTRWEFATAISRMIYHIEDWNNWEAYYYPHLNKLRNEWILTNTDPNRIEKRWLALIILKRIADSYKD